MKNYCLIAFLLASSFTSFAQNVRGKVTDAKTGEAVAYATVVWKGTRAGAVTEVDGQYETTQPAGATHLVFSYVGYVSDTVEYKNEKVLNHQMREPAAGPMVIIDGEIPATHITGRNPQLFQVLGEKELCKAACCNLSESFETNASIDASFADAITGTRQIRMLGLDGKYTQMMFDNMPAVRGLASTYGLTYVPGTWVKNIYIAKGVGSVTSGYESITGQINVAYKNPENAEQLAVNGYGGSGGRLELNVIWKPKTHDEQALGEEHGLMESEDHAGEEEKKPEHRQTQFHPVFLAHGALSTTRTDHNGDGFLDNPLFNNLILRNEWHLTTGNGLGGQYAASYTHINNVSGKLDYDPLDEIRSQLWGVNVTTDRYDISAKTGFVFKQKEWKSFGSQVNASWHDQSGNYGFRQYKGTQLSARVNLLFASRIVNDDHKFTTGASFTYDDYNERLFFNDFPPVPLSSVTLNRLEKVPGVFGEYTWNFKDRFVTVAGLRVDHHNVFGVLVTPRLHTRYSFNDNTSLKVLAGKGYRTPSLLMDNVGILASNRNIVIEGNDPDGLFGLKMEEAWNTGILLTHKFKMNHRDAVLSIDVYRTQFVQQVVMDMEEAGVVRFYNLEGKSYSNSAQAEFQWSPLKRLEWRLAYRWLDVKTQYTSALLEKPLVNKHRAFTNIAYATKEKSKGQHWRWDATVQWISPKRIPYAAQHDEVHTVEDQTYSNAYFQLNAQVTYAIKKDFEFYLGGENLTNFVIHNAIISAENPASENFDGSLVWGPVFGRMGYVGFRWSIK